MNIYKLEFIAGIERSLYRFITNTENSREIKHNKSSIDDKELSDNRDILKILKVTMRSP